ncbi:MAG: hypothetical protein ACTHOB_13115 [Ginsengibacter sp.]
MNTVSAKDERRMKYLRAGLKGSYIEKDFTIMNHLDVSSILEITHVCFPFSYHVFNYKSK